MEKMMAVRHFRIKVEGKTFEVDVEELGVTAGVAAAGTTPPVRAVPGAVPASVPPAGTTATSAQAPKPAASTPAAGQGWVLCPMAGKVQKIPVKVGQTVSADTVVAVLEAMKMETSVCAGTAGTVQEIAASEGAVLDSGAALVKVG